MNHRLSRKFLLITLPVSLAVTSCATNPNTGKYELNEGLKNTFASDDPCNNNARNIGILAGAIVGGLIGNKVSDGKAAGTALGLGLGGLLGGLIGNEVDKRQCELAKIQKKYDLDMQVTQLEIPKTDTGSAAAQTKDENTQKVGLSVSIVDKANKPQFQVGSAALEPDAKLHFSEIAKQYSLSAQQAEIPANKTPAEKQKLLEELKKRRVLLIGHTDDTGNSELNSDLSEKRAKAVAEIFRQNGVEANQLFYQGAGETLPIADNHTEEGRAKNRRVEIVDLSNDDAFSLYLKNRATRTEFYREASPSKPQAVASAPAKEVEQAKVTPAKKPATTQSTKVTPQKPEIVKASVSDKIDFGGSIFDAKLAALSPGELLPTSSNKSIFISQAVASDLKYIPSCNLDRPRSANPVKALKDGKEYATNAYLPGLYGKTWSDRVNGNLVLLNKVYVLQDAGAPVPSPQLKVYKNYKPGSNPEADITLNPQVNTYRGENGLVYRIFAKGEKGLECMDVLLPYNANNGSVAKDGKLIYTKSNNYYLTNFKPAMVKGN